MIIVDYTVVSIVFGFLLYSNSMGQNTYKAAVVEYAPIREHGHLPREVVEKNTKEYVKLINEAGLQGAKIIIFPEYGLTTVEVSMKVPDHLNSYSIEIPITEENAMPNPCNISSDKYYYHKVLRDICSAANESNIYVVINVVERENSQENKTNFKYYSTNIVFDKRGTIIRRYRKINLYEEQSFSNGSRKMDNFIADFGVTFGILIGADILYKNPAGELLRDQSATNIIYSTAWHSEMPFLNGLSIQYGFATINKINLLAACLNDASSNSTGSGIFLADGSKTVHISSAHKSKIIIQDIPIKTIRQQAETCQDYYEKPRQIITDTLPDNPQTLMENMQNYTLEDLKNEDKENYKVCSGNFCCYFTIAINPDSTIADSIYKLAVFFGSRSFGSRTIAVSACAVVACLDQNGTSCGARTVSPLIRFQTIDIRATYTTKIDEIYIQPISVKYGLHPGSNYKFCKSRNESTVETEVNLISTAPQNSLLTFGFLGRIYNSDNLPVGRLKYTDNIQMILSNEEDVTKHFPVVVVVVVVVVVIISIIIISTITIRIVRIRRENHVADTELNPFNRLHTE